MCRLVECIDCMHVCMHVGIGGLHLWIAAIAAIAFVVTVHSLNELSMGPYRVHMILWLVHITGSFVLLYNASCQWYSLCGVRGGPSPLLINQ